MNTVEFKIDYDRRAWNRARKRIHALAERSSNVTPAWNAFLDWFAHGNRLQFGSRGAYWGTPWKELSPQYLGAKREEGYTSDILVRDSVLLRSVADRPMSIERYGPHDMVAGTSVKYAIHHHKGAPRRNIPKRPLWDVEHIRKSNAATSAIRTWIINGNPRIVTRAVR